MLDFRQIHLVETHEERFRPILVGHQDRRDELAGIEFAIQVEVAQQLGTIVPIRAHGNHGESSIADYRPACFSEKPNKPRFSST